MAQNQNKPKVKPVSLGTLALSFDKDGNKIMDESTGKQKYIILLNKDVKISVNGKPVTGGTFKIESPNEGIEYQVQSGKLSKEEAEEKLADYLANGKYAKTKFFVKAFIEA